MVATNRVHLHFCWLGDLQSIVDLDPEIPGIDMRHLPTLPVAPPIGSSDPRVGETLRPTKASAPALLTGVAIAIPAGSVVAGWLLREPGLIHLTPGVTMVFNTALSFFLVALALMADSLALVWRTRVRTLAGAVVAVIAALVLGEYFSGYVVGIDWPALHRWYIDTNPYPGRMSPPAALAFLLCGVAFILMDRVRGLWEGVLIQTLTASIIVVGVVGVAGYLLQLSLVYHHYVFAQMALTTATGFIVTGTGLWLSWRRYPWYRSRVLRRRDDQRIAINGAVILAVTLFILVLTMFAIVEHFMEAMATEKLSQRLENRIELVRLNLELRSARAVVIADRPILTELAETLEVLPDDVDARAKLKAEVESFLSAGITGLAIASPQGIPWFSVGIFASEPGIELPIHGAIPASLVWDEGFVLRTQTPIMRNGKTVGIVTAEQRLFDLTTAFQPRDFFATGEIVVCARRESQLDCFSPRLGVPFLTLAYSPALSMAHALAGEVGTREALDYRGESVIGAYGPIGATGLGMVDKVDTVELYAPLRELLYIAMAIVTLVLGGGVAFLYRGVTPLARELARGKQRLQLALAASHFALWDWDAETNQVYLSEEWEQMLGRPARVTALPVQYLLTIVHPEDRPALMEHLRGVLAGTTAAYDIEHRVRAEDGSWKWIRGRGKVIERSREGRALHVIGTNADITLRKTGELQLTHRANHDALTGLPNRNLFHDRLARAIERARRNQSLMALMYLDIDKLKSVNDTLGHDVGDALLKQFAARVSASVRATDTVARLGGDEFAIILEALDERGNGCRVADKIVAAMRTPFMLGEHPLGVTTSVGIAFHAGQPGIESDRLMKMADEALYSAKAAGRNRVAVADSETTAAGPETAPLLARGDVVDALEIAARIEL